MEMGEMWLLVRFLTSEKSEDNAGISFQQRWCKRLAASKLYGAQGGRPAAWRGEHFSSAVSAQCCGKQKMWSDLTNGRIVLVKFDE